MLGIANNKNGLPINDQIKAREVLVIGPNGEQVGVKSLQDALTLASYASLDFNFLTILGVTGTLARASLISCIETAETDISFTSL